MPQEEVEKKSCDLAIQVSKLSVKEIAKGVDKYLKYLKQRKINKTQVDRSIKGKQTVKQLISQGQGVASMPIGDTHLKDFERVARKYGVDFAVVKDTADDKPRYTVFFKARDADAITQVLKEYSEKQMKRKKQQRKSVREILAKFKELAAQMPRKEKEKKKERSR